MRSGFFAAAAVLGLISAFVMGESVRARGQAAAKLVFLSVVDASGKPVTDLQPNEVALGEDTTRREISVFKAATTPLSIVLLADTTGAAMPFVQDFRRSLTSFVRHVQTARPDSEIMLMEFGQAASPLTSFTTRTADLEKPIGRLYPKPNAASVLLEAIGESSRMLTRRPSPRRAIVILNLEPSIEQSAWRPNQIVDELMKSGASVWAVSLQTGTLVTPGRDVVLRVLAQNTGGLREFILTPNAVEPRLLQIADALIAQYELTYLRPPGAATPKVVQIRVARSALTVRAPAWPPK